MGERSYSSTYSYPRQLMQLYLLSENVPREIALSLVGSKVDVEASGKTKTSSPHSEWNYTHRRLAQHLLNKEHHQRCNLTTQRAPSEVQFDNTNGHNHLRQDSNMQCLLLCITLATKGQELYIKLYIKQYSGRADGHAV